MAVVGNAVAQNDSVRATESEDGTVDISVAYRVVTDDLLDGPLIVLGAPQLPAIHDQYSFGNDANANIFCISREPSKLEKDGLIWQVVCRYSNQSDQEKDENGDPQQDPTLWNKQIEIISQSRQTEVVDAEFIPAGDQNIPGRMPVDAPNQLGRICNSINIDVQPPIMRDDSRYVFRVTRVYANFDFDEAKDYKDAVNSDAWTLIHTDSKSPPNVFEFTFPIRTCKMKTMQGRSFEHPDPATGKTAIYYRRVWEFEYDPKLWTVKVPDKGIGSWVRNGAPDNRCGTVSESDKCPGQAPAIKSVDMMGNMADLDWDLNGKGELSTDPGNTRAATLEWRVYDELPFAGLGI